MSVWLDSRGFVRFVYVSKDYVPGNLESSGHVPVLMYQLGPLDPSTFYNCLDPFTMEACARTSFASSALAPKQDKGTCNSKDMRYLARWVLELGLMSEPCASSSMYKGPYLMD